MSRSGPILLWMLLGLALGLGARPALERFRERGCEETLTTTYSPDHLVRVTLAEKKCDWGFSLGADFASLHVEKLGKDGWFMDIPIQTDQPAGSRAVSLAWTANDTLQATIHSGEYSGSFEHQLPGFRLIQKYTGAGQDGGGS